MSFNFGLPKSTGTSTPGSSATSGSGQTSTFGSFGSFSFNQPNNSSPLASGAQGQKPLFGAVASGGSNTLFGGNAGSGTTSSSTGPSLFSTTGGSGNTGSSLFSKPTTPSSTGTSGGGLFGTTGGTSTPKATEGSGFNFGPKPTEVSSASALFGGAKSSAPATTQGQTTSSLFGSTGTSGTPSFGTSGSNNTSSAPAGASTPASNKPSLFGNTSTTPAVPPPTTLFSSVSQGNNQQTPASSSASSEQKPATSGGSALFGNLGKPQTPQGGSSLFGGQSGQSNPQTPSFSGFKPTSTATSSAPAQPSSTPATSTTGQSLFSNIGSTTPASTKATEAPKPTFSFAGASSTSQPSSLSFSITSSAPSTSGQQSTSQGTTAPGTSGASLFGGIGGAKPATSMPASSMPSIFPSLGQPRVQPATTTTASVASSDTSVTAGILTPTTTRGDGNQPSGPTLGNLGGSTTGPPPPAQSRLKNKSMDEIITRWASDLSKYQKDFQKQAEQVAAWDRLLVENSDKITTLFNKTFQAERDAAEVERQLSNVEMQQHELDTWLTRYEGEVDALLEKQMGGERQGPDSEREKTYKLAEKLSSRLNELNQSLGEMVEETNSISASVSRSNKSDDPLSQVIRVLNSHLAQLQVIDSGAAELKGKIAAAQREGAGIARHNGWNGVGSDPADDFYRSFRGGR